MCVEVEVQVHSAEIVNLLLEYTSYFLSMKETLLAQQHLSIQCLLSGNNTLVVDISGIDAEDAPLMSQSESLRLSPAFSACMDRLLPCTSCTLDMYLSMNCRIPISFCKNI